MGGGGSKFKIEKIFEKIYELKNFTCKRYRLIESSWFWNRFRSQHFWHFSAFPSIQLSFNGLVLFFPHQIKPFANRGTVLINFRSKEFLLKIIVSPLGIRQHQFQYMFYCICTCNTHEYSFSLQYIRISHFYYHFSLQLCQSMVQKEKWMSSLPSWRNYYPE